MPDTSNMLKTPNVYVRCIIWLLTRVQALLCLMVLSAHLVDFAQNANRDLYELNEAQFTLMVLIGLMYYASFVMVVLWWCKIVNASIQMALLTSLKFLTFRDLREVVKTGKMDENRLFLTFLDFSRSTLLILAAIHVVGFMIFPGMIQKCTKIFFQLEGEFALVIVAVAAMTYFAKKKQRQLTR